MELNITAEITHINLRKQDDKLTCDLKLCAETGAEVIQALGVSPIRNAFWLMDTGEVSYQGIAEIRLYQEFKDCDIQLGQKEWQHGVTCKKIALTPLPQFRVSLTLQLTFASLAHPTLRLLADKLHDEIACQISCPDLLEAAA